jgi:AcrR family transcriptional regulator
MTTSRLRRSSEDVRALILESARSLFRSRTYEDVSTREISDRAGVAESALFRHFGSKKAIFDEAMLKPFVEFVQEFIEDWAEQPAREVVPEGLAYRFVAGFSRACAENLDVIEVFGERDGGGQNRPLAGQASELMQRLVDTLAGRVKTYHEDVGLGFTMDPQLSVRLTIALIVGVTHMGQDFVGEIDDQLLAEMSAFVIRGAGYPGDSRVSTTNSLSRTPSSVRRARRPRNAQ